VPLTADPSLGAAPLLPWLTIALVSAATYARLTRAMLLEVLGEDYIRTARAKGLSRRRVTVHHALRSALAPVVTQARARPRRAPRRRRRHGDRLRTAGARAASDHLDRPPGSPTTIGLVLLARLSSSSAKIIVDVLYVVLDPRVRLS